MAILHKEGKLYVAECPEIGIASQGFTREEAIANLKEATALYLEEFSCICRSPPFFEENELPEE